MLPRDLTKHANLFRDYTELRVQENRSNRIVLLNGDVVNNSNSSNSGVSARVFKNGLWGFSSSPSIDEESIKSVVEASTKNAAFMSSKTGRSEEISLPLTKSEYEFDYSSEKPKNTQKQWVEFLKSLDDYVKETYPKVESRTIVLSNLEMEKSLLTSTESTSYSLTPRSLLIIELTTSNNGEAADFREVFGGLGQLEDQFYNPSDFHSKIDHQVDHLMKKAEGVFPEAGHKQVILDADLAGILAHEAIGHTTEADLVLGGSIAGEYLNQEVASPLVTLVDFANQAMGDICPVPVYIDDEGTKAEHAVIIKEGVLQTFMHNKDTARRFNASPTGNARAYQFSDEPLVRMRNTAILPGKDKLDDLIASIDDGYYLMKHSNGQADSTSEFMFGVTLGYEIKNGKLGKAIRDTTISGIAFDVLKTVEMVSDDLSWTCGGMCGKKQIIPVGMGGPAIKCKLNIGGR